MKKTYINPTLEVIKIGVQPLLAGSEIGLSNGNPSEWGSREFDDDFFDE